MTKLIAQWKNSLLVGLLIIITGALLRFYNLNALPIFADEAIYVRWSQVMRAEPTLRFLPLSDGKQPLFMWIVIPFMKVIADPLIAGRVVSGLAGVSTIVAVFVLSYLLFKSKYVALISSYIYSLSPFAVFFDRMALVDSLLSMFGVWIVVLSILTIRYLRLDMAMITGFLLGGALLTKSTATFFAMLIPTTVLVNKLPDKKRGVFYLKMSFLWVVIVVMGFAIYNILRLGPNFNLLVSRTKDYVYPLSHIISSPLDPLKPYLDRSLEYYTMLGPGLIVIFSLFALLGNYKKFPKQILLLLVWIVFPIFVVSGLSKTLTARYILFTLPFVCVLASSSFLLSNERPGLKLKVRDVLLFGLFIFTLISLKSDYYIVTNPSKVNLPRSERSGYLEEWTAGGGIKEASNVIRAKYNSDPSKKIVVGTEGYFGTLPDAMQVYLNDLPEITVIGVGLNFLEVPIQLIESFQAGNQTYLVVNSSRFKSDPEDIGLELVQSWIKADRPMNTREYVQHGLHDTLYLFQVSEVKNRQ
ncbi:glycosyltransferase family 39 protein [Candidatus Woesebacteria bacterium]|nr:MAG: glycosyltransferase family 39 protein [Candidatus Woesebacteria bacterium]